MDESWVGEEKPGLYQHDWLQTRLDWNGNREELVWTDDAVDQEDHEAKYLEDYPDDMSDLEDTASVDTSVYDQLRAIPSNMTVSADMEVAIDMFNLSMGPLEQPGPPRQKESNTPTGRPNSVPSDDKQFNDMFKVPPKVPECQDPMPAGTPRLNFKALLAEAQYKSSWRTLPPSPELRFPPPEVRLHHKDDKDT